MIPYDDDARIGAGPFTGAGPHVIAQHSPGVGCGRFELSVCVHDDSGAMLVDAWTGTYRRDGSDLFVESQRQCPANADSLLSDAEIAVDAAAAQIRVTLTSVPGAILDTMCRLTICGAEVG